MALLQVNRNTMIRACLYYT